MTGYVYAMLSCDRVKIGFSERPKQRLNDANTMSPFRVEMLGYYEGTFKDEQELHKKFDDFRLHGEWFAYSGPVKKWADRIEDSCCYEPSSVDVTSLPTVNLHSRLVKARLNAGFKKAAPAARAIGVNYQTYIGHEDGSRMPKAEYITKYANAFDVSFMWLLYGAGSSSNENKVSVLDWTKSNFFRLKRENKITQKDLARYLNVSQSKVAKMLDGTRSIRSDEIQSLEAYFGVPYSSTPIQEPAE